MTMQLPNPIPLEMPSGDAEAMADLARDIATAGRCLAAMDARISDPAASPSGWLGDDASAAAAQVIRIASLIRAANDAVAPAAERLAAHAERLLETRNHVRALKHQQEEEFADAWRRWGSLPDLQLQVMIEAPQARAIVDELEARERSRRRRHTALLEEVEDDAAGTARVLVDACAAVGGRGRPDDARFVVAYLAAQLPGWGDREQGRRARALASGLTDGTPETKTRAASDAVAFAGNSAFATALLAALGVEGVRYVLRDLGNGDTYAPGSPVARVLAAAFGAADVGAATGSAVQRVLDAEYVHAEDEFATAGTIATGLAVVLAAGRSTPSGGVATRTVASWGRQFLLWENRQRERIGTRSVNWAPEAGDPTGLAISILAQRAEPAVSAAFLDDPRVWQAALRRVYDDSAAALGKVVAQAGLEPGERGDRALRMGLATAGAGLAGDDPSAWTVNRHTFAGVASDFGDALSAHIDVAVGVLKVGVDGKVHGDGADVLAGLGYVTLDRDAAAAVQEALTAWAQVRPEAVAGSAPQGALPPADVLGAYAAVQEFAQRTDHAMDALEDRVEAQSTQALEKGTFGLLTLVPGPVGVGLGLLEGCASIALHKDGTWIDRPDRGLVVARADAAALARTALAPRGVSEVRRVVRQARAAFDRTAASMPIREAPMSPKADPVSSLLDVGTDMAGERSSHEHGGHVSRVPLPH
jgi:hypothetical protein